MSDETPNSRFSANVAVFPPARFRQLCIVVLDALKPELEKQRYVFGESTKQPLALAEGAAAKFLSDNEFESFHIRFLVMMRAVSAKSYMVGFTEDHNGFSYPSAAVMDVAADFPMLLISGEYFFDYDFAERVREKHET